MKMYFSQHTYLAIAIATVLLHTTYAEDATYTDNHKTGTGDSSIEGGAITNPDETTLSNKENITFGNNSVTHNDSYSYGGAISSSGSKGNEVIISNNTGIIQFENNKATTSNTDHEASGGAIYTDAQAPIQITGNKEINFINNSATATTHNASGGAIKTLSDTNISNNGKILFSGNYTNTGKLVTSNATASDEFGVQYEGSFGQPPTQGGGALNVTGDLKICNNESVVFEKNYEITTKEENGTTTTSTVLSGIRLQGYVSDPSSTKTQALYMSAADGKSIEIRDRVVVDRMAAGQMSFFGSGYKYTPQDMHLNQAYEGIEQSGTIIFTGKYTEEHLKEVKGGIAGTDAEIKISRTSAVTGDVYLHNGTLSVEDTAILLANNVNIATGAELATKLSHTDGIAYVNSLTAIQVNNADVAGTINADLTFEDGAALTLHYGNISLESHALTLGTSTLLDILTINTLTESDNVILFTNVSAVNFESGVLASEYFSGNIIDKGTSLVFENNTVSLKGAKLLPEPTTATLSLLALVGLALRRRRVAL